MEGWGWQSVHDPAALPDVLAGWKKAIAAIRYKANLPNYGVFDEKRLFARGPAAGPVTVRGIRVGVPICEDIWLEESEEYENVVECLAETGAEILVVPNGSPYAGDKGGLRPSIAVADRKRLRE